MSKIAVIGLGQGGTLAAQFLAQAGYTVEIFEKAAENEVSYPWHDDIVFDIFRYCGIQPPEREFYTQKSKWLFVSPDEKNSLKVPPAPPMTEVSISRRGLVNHLIRLAVSAGATVHYGANVNSLLIRDDRVVGIVLDEKELFFDLVIDASGLNSPFRGQVPSKFGIQANPGKNDIMLGYRAFFKRGEGSESPDPESTLYIKHLDGVGISWCNLNESNETDVLIGRIGELTDEECKRALATLKANHPILSDKLIFGQRVDIGVRCPLGMMVADGYVAVGDSAFMTMPIMGSGIEAAMKAGKWLAEVIINNDIQNFTARNLWEYQRKFFDELGEDYVFIDVLKRWALNIDPKQINWLFGCGVVTDDDMALLSTDTDNSAKLKVFDIIKKLFILLKNPRLIGQAIKWLLKGLRAKRIAEKMPESYDAKKVAAWLEKYDGIIRKIEGENR